MRLSASFATILATFYIAVSASGYDQVQQVLGVAKAGENGDSRRVRLRQIQHHGSHRYPHLHRVIDIDNVTTTIAGSGPFSIITAAIEIERLARRSPSDIDSLLAQTVSPTWELASIHAPNITNKQTILSFARMSANAYYEGSNQTGWKWKDISKGYNYTSDFGWEEDGLRGHVFVDEGNASVVVALKGTSVPWLDDPSTTHRDLLNDNLFASCCCGQSGSIFWKPVCDCALPSKDKYKTCNSTCLEHELRNSSHYYSAARKIFEDVREQYPHSDIWLTGHSLGGVVASLLGWTYGASTVTFEAFPEALAATRIGLPIPPGKQGHVVHIGNTADPIYMASCDGSLSPCSLWGYAFESQCHTGKRCVYDTVGDLGWWVEVRNHGIERVIEEVIGVYEAVPECREVGECGDCEGWRFVDGEKSTEELGL